MGGSCWHWLLEGLRTVRVRFELETRGAFWLPEWPGSMLRGALGGCLKDLDDASSGRAYEALYRERGSVNGRACDATTDTPRPYIIEWSAPTGSMLEAGGRFTFDIVLIGPAIAVVPLVAAAVDAAAARGLGTQRIPHRLAGVRVVEGGARGVLLRDTPDPLPPLLSRALELRAVTPLMLHREVARAQELDAESLLVAGVRRARQLATQHGDLGAPVRAMDDELREEARRIRLVSRRMHWVSTERDSRTAGRKVPLGGLVGSFTLLGDLESLRPLLRAMLLLHVGRQVSQGLGRLACADAASRADAPEARTSPSRRFG